MQRMLTTRFSPAAKGLLMEKEAERLTLVIAPLASNLLPPACNKCLRLALSGGHNDKGKGKGKGKNQPKKWGKQWGKYPKKAGKWNQ